MRIPFFTILMFGSLLGFESAAAPLNSLMEKWRITLPNAERFTYGEADYATVSRGTRKYENLLARGNGEIVRIQRISDQKNAALATWFKDKQLQLESIYGGAIDPYFAGITERSKCPKEFFFKKTSAASSVHYSTFANMNLTIGVCTADSVRYHVVTSIFSCPTAALMVERFFPGGFISADLRMQSLAKAKTTVTCKMETP